MLAILGFLSLTKILVISWFIVGFISAVLIDVFVDYKDVTVRELLVNLFLSSLGLIGLLYLIIGLFDKIFGNNKVIIKARRQKVIGNDEDMNKNK